MLYVIVYGYSFQLYNTNEVRILQDYRKIIREKREKKGLSQSALAKLVGVSQPAINQVESGARTPSLALLMKICDALEITMFSEDKEDE